MQHFYIDNKNQGQTLFRYIKKTLPGLKNSDIFKLIRKKVITVNNKKKDSKYILNKNDIINIYLKDIHIKQKNRKNKFQTINNQLNIIYEDNDILVINKPIGLLTHPDKKEYIPIEGDVPSPVNPPPGCAFHPRCAYRQNTCSKMTWGEPATFLQGRRWTSRSQA